MADALCGPSNPLQSFRKHAQVDRTLQQDRLVGPRHSSAQGFRTPDPRAGSLDADFHAFENAPPNAFQFQPPDLVAPVPSFAPHAPAVGWASDFQKLHISNSPIPAQQFRAEAPLIRSSNGGWHDEFMRQRSSASTPIALEKQAVRDNPMSSMSNQNLSGGLYNQPMFQPSPNLYQQSPMFQQEQSQHFEQHAQMSDAAFEQAFTDAFSQAEQMDQIKDAHQILHEDGAYTNDHSHDMSDLRKSDIRIGSDAINYTEVKDRTMDQDTRDADELARTAGQVVNSLQHDTSTKFQNSQFLDLMRKIRDREIEVQNNDLQNASGQATADSHSTTKNGLAQYGQSQAEPNLQPHDPNTFQFPDMNSVYEAQQDTSARSPYSGSWDYPPTSAAEWRDGVIADQQTDFNYNTDSDQYPLTQIHALHPGGRMYPEQSPRLNRVQMSGGVGNSNEISAEDFERSDESGHLATRYQKPRVDDESASNAA